jgi:hypothetical protein
MSNGQEATMEYIAGHRNHLLISALLVSLTLVLHADIMDGNWRWHDAQILYHLYNYPWTSDFLDPIAWQVYSPVNLTPWQIVLYRMDYQLAGLSPAFYYAHHLLSLAAVAVALYFLQLLWIGRLYAAIGATLFLVGVPVFFVSEQLMTRHYVEGSVYAILALYLFVTALRHHSTARILASALFYALAMASKEIFVPLVILLMFIPERDCITRLKMLIPHIALILIYIVWRGFMLVSVDGGYSDSSQYLTPSFMVTAFTKLATIPLLLFNQWWPAAVAILIAILALSIKVGRFPFLMSALVLALLLGPLYPLAGAPGFNAPDRYFFLVWIVLCFALGFNLHRILGQMQFRRPATLGLLGATAALGVISLVHGLQIKRDLAHTAAEFDVHSEFIWDMDHTAAFFPTLSLAQDYWAVTDLSLLKQAVTGRSGPISVPDDVFLREELNALFEYDPACQCMRDITDSLPQRLSLHRQSLRPGAPLSAEFHYQDNLISWRFGPYSDGEYHVVSTQMGRLPVPPQIEGLRISIPEHTSIHVRYRSPEGWVTYSDLLSIERNTPVRWHRN